MKKTIIVDSISILFVVVFVYAGSSKLIDHQKFIIELGKSPLLSPFSILISWTVPFLEIGIAVMLTVGQLQLKALYAALAMMSVFTIYIIFIMNFSPYIPCSCGGILRNMSWGQHLIFNTIFLFLSISGILISPLDKRTIAR